MAAVADLYNIASAFLAASITALQETAAGPPERAFVAPGDPALDCCDQLTVHTASLGEYDLLTGPGALAKPHAINRGGKPGSTLQIQITRCVPVPREASGTIILPDPVDQQTAARIIDEDGWALWLGLSAALKHGDLAQICEGAERLGAVKMTPQGGCGGWVFTYRYPIQGGILA